MAVKHKRKGKSFYQDVDLEVPLMKAIAIVNEKKPIEAERINMSDIINDAIRIHLKKLKAL